MLELITLARPIPRKLLPDSITYKAKTGEGSRGPVFAADVTVSYVLIQRKLIKKRTDDGYEVIGKATLVYDYVNSDPVTVEFANRDVVIDNRTGEEYTVNGFVEQPTLQGKHHIEVILI